MRSLGKTFKYHLNIKMYFAYKANNFHRKLHIFRNLAILNKINEVRFQKSSSLIYDIFSIRKYYRFSDRYMDLNQKFQIQIQP